MNLYILFQVKILSFMLRNISPNYYDAVAKFKTINKIWHNIKLDSIPGDYAEPQSSDRGSWQPEGHLNSDRNLGGC